MRARRALDWALLVLILSSLGAAGQESAPDRPALRVLLVDETRTFGSTMRVGALAGVLKRSGLVEVSVLLVDVASSYDDPLRGTGEPGGGAFDAVVIVPRGIDDGTADWIWVIARTPSGASPDYPRYTQGIEVLSQVIEAVFSGVAHAVDPLEDLFPAGLAALYVQEGILR